MVSLRIDQQTAEQLEALAAERGMTLDGFLRALAGQGRGNSRHDDSRHDDSRHDDSQRGGMSSEEVTSELKPLLFKGPSLPSGFSREDIYVDHN